RWLVRMSEQGGRDIPHNRPRIRMVQDVLRRQRDTQRIRMLAVKFNVFRQSQVEKQRARPAAVIPVQESLVWRRVRIQQPVRRLNEARFIWNGSNTRTAIEKRRSIQVVPNRDVERWTGRDIQQRTEHPVPFRVDRPTEAEAVTHVRRGRSVLSGEAIWVGRK